MSMNVSPVDMDAHNSVEIPKDLTFAIASKDMDLALTEELATVSRNVCMSVYMYTCTCIYVYIHRDTLE